MTGLADVKRWWSNNPVMACGLGSLALMASLFFFPFGAAFVGVVAVCNILLSWVSVAAAAWFNVMDGNTKLYFAVVGFFAVFFACLSFKKCTNSVYKARFFSWLFLVMSCAIFVCGWLVSGNPARTHELARHVDVLGRQESLLTNIEFSTHVCEGGSYMQMTPMKVASPGGRQVFLCEKKEDGRYAVAKRSLSEVNWIELSCLMDELRCTRPTWGAAYSPAKQGIVFETSTQLIAKCKRYLSELPSSVTQVTVNGKPADPALCGYGTNTITAVYAPKWFKE